MLLVERPADAPAGSVSLSTSLWVAFCALAPIVIISALTHVFRAHLSPEFLSTPDTSIGGTKVALMAVFRPRDVPGDSWQHMINALSYLRGPPPHDHLYERVFFEMGSKFQYPPSSLLLLDLLDRFGLARNYPLNVINSFVCIANAAATGLLAALVFRKSGSDGSSSPSWPMVAAAIVAMFAYYPLVESLYIGQIQLLIDVLVTLACAAWVFGRKDLAGFLFAPICAIKPQYGLLVVWGLLARQWAFARSVLLILVPVLLLSLLLYGFRNHLGYLSVLSFLSQHGEAFWHNQSINGILNGYFDVARTFSPDPGFPPVHAAVYWTTTLVSLGSIVFIILFALWRTGPATIFDFGVVTICATVFSPIAWRHHYGAFFPFYIIMLGSLLSATDTRYRGTKLALLALSWTLTATLMPHVVLLAGTPLQFLEAHVLFGGLLLLGLMLNEVLVEQRSNHRSCALVVPAASAAS